MYTYQDLYDAEPCKEGREFLEDCEQAGLTLAEAWSVCENASHMLWALWVLDIVKPLSPTYAELMLAMLDTPMHDGLPFRKQPLTETQKELLSLYEKIVNGDDVNSALIDEARSKQRIEIENKEGSDVAIYLGYRVVFTVAQGIVDSIGEKEFKECGSHWSARKEAMRWQADKVREIVVNPFN